MVEVGSHHSICLRETPVGEARFWRAFNIREAQIEAGDTVVRSVRQRVYDVAGMKAAKERENNGRQLSAQAIAKLYEKHVKWAGRSEAVTFGFVDCAVTITKRLLSIPAAAQQLEWLDDHFHSSKNRSILSGRSST